MENLNNGFVQRFLKGLVMDKIKVGFQYKGDRDYIHGTDMFNRFMELFPKGEKANIRFSVHGFVKEPNAILYSTINKEELDNLNGLKARCEMQVEKQPYWLAFKPLPSDGSQGVSYEYDEDSLVAQCKILGNLISLSGRSEYTFIETVVAMKKSLVQSLFPDVNGKWVFTRIDLPFLCTETSGICVKFKHNMNFRLLKSEILVNGEKVGDIYFSLVKS